MLLDATSGFGVSINDCWVLMGHFKDFYSWFLPIVTIIISANYSIFGLLRHFYSIWRLAKMRYFIISHTLMRLCWRLEWMDHQSRWFSSTPFQSSWHGHRYSTICSPARSATFLLFIHRLLTFHSATTQLLILVRTDQNHLPWSQLLVSWLLFASFQKLWPRVHSHILCPRPPALVCFETFQELFCLKWWRFVWLQTKIASYPTLPFCCSRTPA